MSSQITTAAIESIEALFSSLPVENKKELLKRLIKKEDLINEAMTCFYFDGNLSNKRFEKEDIVSAFHYAWSRFPSQDIFYISDEYDFDFELPHVVKIEPCSISKMFRTEDDSSKVFVCAFESDEQLVQALNEINKLRNSYYYNPLKYYPTARYFHRNDIARKVLMHENGLGLPKFEVADYENIIQAIDITSNVEGAYVEIGVYQGRSAHMALHYMRERGIKRNSFFFDIFQGFTYDSATTSPDALWVNSHTDCSQQAVIQFLSEFESVEVAKLDIIENNLPATIGNIAVCNIDVDMYEAVLAALTKTAPFVAKGGVIIVEDQGHTPALAGGFLALWEFLETEQAKAFVPVHLGSGQMFLIKR